MSDSPTAEDWSLPGKYGEVFHKVENQLNRLRNSQKENNMASRVAEIPKEDAEKLALIAEIVGKRDDKYAGEIISDFLEDIGVFRVSQGVDDAKQDPSRIIAEYNMHEYVSKDNRTKKHVGTQFWDVTDLIEIMDEEEVSTLIDNHPSTGQLLHKFTEHEGPHSVYVNHQIQRYWEHVHGVPLWGDLP